ncbi:sugar O-acyltransferase, sialic acid O-acetyltransferase NeuD family [Cellulophaga algicola DSM 14237]|uniref:Sugar O-acyltransferase, sialic acid O-acetyltransferase NeuD family n=1 Tax=Cellulophaga algicola (strain DSM 14237 / IC166 / ACAM 630) TaxID=688270 RepID=E6X458_CELAD|nr:acetyltransferase [Cellulophaga algicola]ADV50400.1 sugar O-acyltransferase, sialic acid O-acetyltransferase NeuD family [Cellulophaga algicola DSM 14237]
MKKIIVFGASGHAKVVIDIIEEQNQYEIFGLIDSYKAKDSCLFEYKILGSEDALKKIVSDNNIYGIVIAIGDNCTRKSIVNKVRTICPDLHFINAIHPNAILGKNVALGEGNVIMPGVIVNSDTTIGDSCIVNTNASVGHDSILKDFSSVSPGVKIGGNLELGFCSAISIGATVIENITIGDHTIIGAAAVVTKNFPDCVVAYGSPAKIIRARTEDDRYLFSRAERKGNRAVLKYEE